MFTRFQKMLTGCWTKHKTGSGRMKGSGGFRTGELPDRGLRAGIDWA